MRRLLPLSRPHPVGTLVEIWRYPVKSMQGERLSHARVGPHGVVGDRGLAVLDAGTGHAISGKRLEVLLAARARSTPEGAVLELPDGRALHAGEPATDEALSGWLGRPVRLARVTTSDRPVIDSEGGRTFLGRPGSFHDSAPLHLVTTATLAHLSSLYPAGVFDRRRFRPNLVVGAKRTGPVEQDWVGHRLRIGALELDVVGPCTRCIMTTSAQDDLPSDRRILATIAREQDQIVGINLRARGPGEVRAEDPVGLLPG